MVLAGLFSTVFMVLAGLDITVVLESSDGIVLEQLNDFGSGGLNRFL